MTIDGGRVTSEPQRIVAELSRWFAQVPHDLVMAKNPDALALYAFLDRMRDSYGSIRFLMAGTGLSQRRLQTARDYLVNQEWLIVVREGTNRRATDYLLPWRKGKSVLPVDTQRITSEYDSVSPVDTQSEYPENIPSEVPTAVGEQQPLIPEDLPQWFQTLSRDSRWPRDNPRQYVQTMETNFPDINLDLEAHAAYEFLQSKKGQEKKVLRGFWTRWLKNASNPRPSNGNGKRPERTAEELEAGWK